MRPTLNTPAALALAALAVIFLNAAPRAQGARPGV